MGGETGEGTGTVRVKVGDEDVRVDPAAVLLTSTKHTMAAEEDERLKKKLDHAEKAHRGVSWPFFRRER